MQGGLSQDERERMMKKLRGGQVDPLVATDVAARGLDISHLTHVVKLRPTLRAGALRPSAPRLSRTAVTTTRSAGGESTS
jgi:superfamily II DNA/RNA helicase